MTTFWLKMHKKSISIGKFLPWPQNFTPPGQILPAQGRFFDLKLVNFDPKVDFWPGQGQFLLRPKILWSQGRFFDPPKVDFWPQNGQFLTLPGQILTGPKFYGPRVDFWPRPRSIFDPWPRFWPRPRSILTSNWSIFVSPRSIFHT